MPCAIKFILFPILLGVLPSPPRPFLVVSGVLPDFLPFWHVLQAFRYQMDFCFSFPPKPSLARLPFCPLFGCPARKIWFIETPSIQVFHLFFFPGFTGVSPSFVICVSPKTWLGLGEGALPFFERIREP